MKSGLDLRRQSSLMQIWTRPRIFERHHRLETAQTARDGSDRVNYMLLSLHFYGGTNGRNVSATNNLTGKDLESQAEVLAKRKGFVHRREQRVETTASQSSKTKCQRKLWKGSQTLRIRMGSMHHSVIGFYNANVNVRTMLLDPQLRLLS
jgi:hypothetical protein